MDDSAGGARILADDISKFWVELLSQIDDSGKREMFQWFMEQLRKAEKGECKAFCREHWQNTAACMYYIGLCEEESAYEEALQALDESIAKERSLSKLQIREKYRQQLNQMAEMMLVAAAGIVFCGRKLYKSR